MEYAEVIISILLAVIASSGFWSYRIKKLERKYQVADNADTLKKSIDTLIESHKTLNAKLDKLMEKHQKTNDVTMAVARDRIYYLCQKWIREDNFHQDNMRDLKSLMEPYQANDGDGLADEYFDRYSYLYKTSGGK